MTSPRNPIRSFADLDVYQRSYRHSLQIIKQVLPVLPADENNDLKDQLRRSCKAIPRLIAEGYSKQHQKHGFQKYLDDALAESNETIVSLSHVRDLYATGEARRLCDELVSEYNEISKMLYGLRMKWKSNV
jgi:four helix bundle protein